MRTLLFLSVLAASTQLHAGWITWTTVLPGQALAGTFDSAPAAYNGIVTATLSNLNTGGNTTSLGISPVSFANASLTNSFTNNVFTNANGSFTALAAQYDDSQENYSLTLNFTGLANGYLPSGTVFALGDLDILENFRNVTAFDSTGAQITVPWLSALSSPANLLDFNVAGGDITGSIVAPGQSNAGGVYQFLGNAANDDSAFVGFSTAQNIRSITLLVDKSNNSVFQAGAGGGGLAIGVAAPEPGSLAMFGIGAGLLFLARKRKSA